MTAPAEAAPMRDDVTQADRAWVVLAISMIERDVRLSELTDDEIDTLIVASRHRPHTARPDAGDEDVERVAKADGMIQVPVSDIQFCIDAIAHLKEQRARLRLEAMLQTAAMREGVDRGMVERLRTELAWYGEQARLARLIHSEGDAGRNALAADGGKRALAALDTEQPR